MVHEGIRQLEPAALLITTQYLVTPSLPRRQHFCTRSLPWGKNWERIAKRRRATPRLVQAPPLEARHALTTSPKKAEAANAKAAVDEAKKAAVEDAEWSKGAKSSAKQYVPPSTPPAPPRAISPTWSYRATTVAKYKYCLSPNLSLKTQTEKQPKPKKPKQLARKPKKTPSWPPRRPVPAPPPKVPTPAQHRRKPEARSTWANSTTTVTHPPPKQQPSTPQVSTTP